jgi:nitroreductase
MTNRRTTPWTPMLLALLALLAPAPACNRAGDPPAPGPAPEAAAPATAVPATPAPATAADVAPVDLPVEPDGMPTPTTAADATPESLPVEPGGTPADLSFDPAQPIVLPPPDLGDPAPLMAALRDRRSTRTFLAEQLSLPLLSNLLWAANGVNRPESGKRTAPTARNRQDLDVYVATAQGLFLYLPGPHQLQPVLEVDLRVQTGKQPFVGKAPLELIFVSDLAKLGAPEEREGLLWAGSHAGFVSQNVYLYCAAHGLATVVRAWLEKAELAAAMGLRPDQLIVLAQSVGYPAEEGAGAE